MYRMIAGSRDVDVMNVLITGSNGFIGSNVCEYLVGKGITVIGLDRTEDSKADVCKYICCDIDSDKIDTLMEDYSIESIDAIIHLAADMRREPYNVEVVRSNCTGTQRLLELCEKQGIKTFLQLSSLPVIGKPVSIPVTEEHPLLPPTVYHATKVMEEMLADYAYRMHGIRSASFRISAPVGPRMNKKTIFSVFVHNALDGKPIMLSGKGNRRQTFIHVSDIAQALYLSLIDDKIAGVFNLSSYNYLSNRELAQKVVETLKSNSEIRFSGIDDVEDDVDWRVSIEKIQKAIDYKPQVNIEDAIRGYADWIRAGEI